MVRKLEPCSLTTPMLSVVSTEIGKDFGMSGRLFLHIQSFLSDRCARLKIDKIYNEDWIDSNDGTSAGTRLAPLLFLMYMLQ